MISAERLESAKPITVAFKNTPLTEVLESTLSKQNLAYTIEKNTIVIKEKEASLLDKTKSVILNLFQDLKGKVTDEQGKPLPNASIRIKGTNVVKNTDEKGEFEIKDVADDAVLQVSYVGYKTLEIAVKGAVMPLAIKLNPQTGELQEVKIAYNTGYQELNLKNTTGSVVQIDNELFNRQVGTNVLDRIYNVASGLINNPTANRNLRENIIIRGQSTINGNPKPLIVVDNFPYDGDLANLNPNDVESITVLKDAAASAIWGVRAGNGVIVVNTKKGKLNQSNQVSITANVNIKGKPDLSYIPYLSSKEMIDLEISRFKTGMYNVYDDLYPSFNVFPVLPEAIEILLAGRKTGVTDPTTSPNVTERLAKLASHDIRDDINKYMVRNVVNQQYAVNLSGGGNKYSYYASAGYDRNLNENLGDNNNRLSINLNNTFRPVKSLEIRTSLVHARGNASNTNNDFVSQLPSGIRSIYTRLVDDQGNPLAVPKIYRTAYIDTISYPGLLDWHYRPLEEHNYSVNTSKQKDTRIATSLSYAIIEGLKAEIQYQNQTSLINDRQQARVGGFEQRDMINQTMYRDGSGNLTFPYPVGDRVTLNAKELNAWNVRGSLNMGKHWGNHEVMAIAGIEYRETTSDGNFNTLYGVDPETNSYQTVNFNQGISTRPEGVIRISNPGNPEGSLMRYGSHFANASYNYKGKYLLSASGRIDESNFFGLKTNLRRTPLWSAGLGWNLHLEDFYKLSVLSQLKLRASYGSTGNTNPGATSFATFRYRSASDEGSVPYTGANFGQILTPGNPRLRWEKVKIFNMGIDFSLSTQRITGSLEYYTKKGEDLLGFIFSDPTSGVISFSGNQASTKGSGFDITLQSKNLTGKLIWLTTLRTGYNRDIVESYNDVDVNTPYYVSGLVAGGLVKVGAPLSAIYSYHWAGLNPVNGDPRLYLADTISSFTNSSTAKEQDLVFNGQRNPKWFGSVMNSLTYRSFNLSTNIIFRFGHVFRRESIDPNVKFALDWSVHSDYAKRWQIPGDENNTNVPSIPTRRNSTRSTVYQLSDILIEPADCVRLQDIRVSYTLNKNVNRKLPFTQVELFIYASNLGVIWRANKLGLDPDAYQYGRMPAPKTIAFGLNVNF